MSDTVESIGLQLALRSADDQVQTLRDLRSTAATLIAGGVAGTGVAFETVSRRSPVAGLEIVMLSLLMLEMALGAGVLAPALGWRSRGESSALLAYGQRLPQSEHTRFVAGIVARYDQYFLANEQILSQKGRWLRFQMFVLSAEAVIWLFCQVLG